MTPRPPGTQHTTRRQPPVAAQWRRPNRALLVASAIVFALWLGTLATIAVRVYFAHR